MQTDGHGAGTFAEQRHALPVAAERVDVLLDPVERHQLVVQARVARRLGVAAQTEEAQCADTITYLHRTNDRNPHERMPSVL